MLTEKLKIDAILEKKVTEAYLESKKKREEEKK